MTANGVVQIAIYLAVLVALVKPLGAYMARVYQGQPCGLDRCLGWLERWWYRLAGIQPEQGMTWRQYAAAVLTLNLLGFLLLYGLLRCQHWLPGNPQEFGPVGPDLAFNTAMSFVSNTNWQSYGGESTMSYAAQMAGLAVQNFLSAATGMAVLVALVRGLTQRGVQNSVSSNPSEKSNPATLGNFWVDMTRSVLYILLPLSLVLAVVLASQGVVQTFSPYQKAALVQATHDDKDNPVTEQVIALGPAASQIAIKQLGTNGGGFFNANGAHPFENPTPLSNFLQLLAILLIPASLCFTYGRLAGDARQGWVLLAAMLVVFIPLAFGCCWAEQSGNPALTALGVDQNHAEAQPGGNMEGKEARFGIANSALWACATTAASNGSVNAMHDSFTPLGGLIPLWLMQLGEVIFGGVGSGLYGMLVFAILAVFLSGLMVGRTPEYLGKKIEAFEVKMAALIILIPPLLVLGGTALAVSGPGLNVVEDGQTKSLLNNPGAHGFSEILYAFSSAGNNNGSAFGGLNANVPFYNLWLGLAMFIGRFGLIVPVLALAGGMARKPIVAAGPGAMPTHTPLFVAILVGTVLLIGALTFLPALALGPVVEHLLMVKS